MAILILKKAWKSLEKLDKKPWRPWLHHLLFKLTTSSKNIFERDKWGRISPSELLLRWHHFQHRSKKGSKRSVKIGNKCSLVWMMILSRVCTTRPFPFLCQSRRPSSFYKYIFFTHAVLEIEFQARAHDLRERDLCRVLSLSLISQRPTKASCENKSWVCVCERFSWAD